MPIKVIKQKGKFRIVERHFGEHPLSEFDQETGEYKPVDGGGFDQEHEAIAKKASIESKRGCRGSY